MKIICVDNFNRETIDDELICENTSKYMGKIIVKLLNNKFSGDNSSSFFKLVEDNYKLFKFEP